MQRLLMVGLNHATAALAVREKLAFNAESRKAALAAFREKFPQSEAVLLSTCNRMEMYVGREVHGHPRAEEMIDFLAAFRGLEVNSFQPFMYEKAEREAAAHLFAVASSLDSMVLGETQILGQVRDAYDAAKDLSLAGATLNPLFQKAIAVGKQVMSGTSIAEGRLSVASVAVDYARRIFDRFSDKTVLSIGAGKMATLVLQSFKGLQPGRLMITNRDPKKAMDLAGKFDGEAVAFEALNDHLIAADIVLTSTGSTQPIITRAQFQSILKQRRYRPIFVMDIALPRDVEASAAELEHVYLYNIDDLQQTVSATQSQRRESIDAARAIIEREVNDFVAWNRTREMGPTIEKLYARYHKVALEELERTMGKMPNLSQEQRHHLEELTRRIVNKLLHDPVNSLRFGGDAHVPTAIYLHAMEKLFKLEEDDAESKE